MPKRPQDDGEEKADQRAEDSSSPPADPGEKPSKGAKPRSLKERMALPEPQRTAELEKAAQAGEVVNLRAIGKKPVVQTYGKTVLRVPADRARPFQLAHAIHLLFYRGAELEEVADEEV